MSLNISKGNMYDFVSHTWNTVKGSCYHDCSYCYMKRWGKLNHVRFDGKELKTDLGENNFIFVGSSCDMFAKDIPEEWIIKTLKHCEEHENKYLFQSKSPDRFMDYIDKCVITDKSVICTTIESDIYYPEIQNNSPDVFSRAIAMNQISEIIKTYITIEPIMDFNIDRMVKLIRDCRPEQVNIGADSGNNDLPEPPPEKVKKLIIELSTFTNVKVKNNLKSILGEN